MEIKVVQKHGIPDRFLIYLDEDFFKEIHRSIFGKSPHFPNCENAQAFEQNFYTLEYQRVRKYVIWRLSMQNYHSKEIMHLLKNRLVSQKNIKRIIDEFIDKGFFNDQLWVESFIRLQLKRLALPVILRKMRLKGFCDEEIENIRLNWQDDEQEKASIQHLISTRYRSKNFSDFKEKQKVVNTLLRKGYKFENIKYILNSLTN